ncbi:hypothetical protein CRUP_035947, partial [Coryphaenoides rupestris]
MGNTATKFRKAVVSGDEALAWQLYEGNPQFREGLDPNASYGEQYQHNTPLHYVCRHAMTRLLRSSAASLPAQMDRSFPVSGKEGNPNKRNVHNETCLACTCCARARVLLLPEGALSPRLARPQRDEQRRADSLQMILSWTGARLGRGQYERANHTDLALSLESQMVFSSSSTATAGTSSSSSAQEAHADSGLIPRKEPYEGLKLQDLRRLKDMTPRSPLTLTLTSPTDSCLTPGEEALATCGICLCAISVFEDPEGDHNILCPAYGCYQLVPVQVIESIVSREMDQRYLQFDIKAFVENNPAIRWCPAVRCERAVRLTRPGPGDSDPHGFPLLPSPAVDCGKGHLFCWECLGEAHEPCDCETWRKWLQKVTEMRPEELAGVGEAYEDAANCLWLLTNSKPCANCKSPIQKNEGCNHMQCAKQLEEQSKDMTGEAEKKHKSFQELDRFMHYYTRFKNHEHSYKGTPPDTRFIEDGVSELLKTRRVLKCSYPYGFFLQPGSTQKEIFELMQTDLEMVVEDLAQKVNRPYLRTPRHKIISGARLVQQKRQEFLASVARGVAPNDSPDAPAGRGSWDWEYLGFASPDEYADLQYRRRHRQRRRGDMLSLHSLRSGSNTPETGRRSDSSGRGAWHPWRELPVPSSSTFPTCASSSNPLPLPPPPPALCAELLELGNLCLPSPDMEPDLLVSPVIPPGRAFTPSDPQSLEPLDPEAGVQLLDNIMAWFNHNINPQNSPQSLALIPSPPTTETESSPDTLTEPPSSESHASGGPAPPPVWQPLEGEPEVGKGAGTSALEAEAVCAPEALRPDTLELDLDLELELENRKAGVEGQGGVEAAVDVAREGDPPLDEAGPL